MAIIGPMSDEKPGPVDDLKQGLNLLFRAAKGAVDKIPTERIEGAVKSGAKELEAAVKSGAKEVGKALETVVNEIDGAVTRVTTGTAPPPQQPDAAAQAAAAAAEEARKNEPPAHFDDAYAPEPPKGPRVG
jgi:hypothetical protein